jgi:M6 family metalloprotease-like protein
MKATIYRYILLLLLLIDAFAYCFARPAIKTPVEITQPDGTKLLVRLHGDEFLHFVSTSDGYLLKRDQNGFYNYAEQVSDGSFKLSGIIAKDLLQRDNKTLNYLKTLPKGISQKEAFQKTVLSKHPLELNKTTVKVESVKNRLKSATSSTDSYSPDILLNDFPRFGNPKSLVILVNFKNKSFLSTNNVTAYSEMLNQVGYSKNNHVGSVRDYYNFNSNGQFTPEFDVVGPVTISKDSEYYGANNAEESDVNVASMITEACLLVDSTVDFSQYDFNHDGIVDNVYIYYAGRGEADGGGANTIWPHSFNLKYSNINLKLDSVTIDHYACSNELNYLNEMDGIGAFTHEYGHVIGLPDMYDVDYGDYNGDGFDLNYWSLMASGSYNNNSCTPPCLSVVERYILGWTNPQVLDSVQKVQVSDFGTSNSGFKINTKDPGEFYLLENRQKTVNVWDAYIPYHGMLIYHIDMRENDTTIINYYGTNYRITYANCWRNNLVNAISAHQCCDLEEADNTRTFYTGSNYTQYMNGLKGDPFPGTSNIIGFSDGTTPSMKTWNGTLLQKPISSILEQSDSIQFDFMNFPVLTPVCNQATLVTNYSFRANWQIPEYASGVYIDAFTIDSYNGDTLWLERGHNVLYTDSFYVYDDLDDFVNYTYRIRAAYGTLTSSNSNEIHVQTLKATSIYIYVKDRSIYLKGIDKGSQVSVYDLSGLLIKESTSNIISIEKAGIYIISASIDNIIKRFKVRVQ